VERKTASQGKKSKRNWPEVKRVSAKKKDGQHGSKCPRGAAEIKNLSWAGYFQQSVGARVQNGKEGLSTKSGGLRNGREMRGCTKKAFLPSGPKKGGN